MTNGGFGYGLGILKGMGVTLKHLVNTYVEDIGYFIRVVSRESVSRNEFELRQGPKARGLYTVEYPDEKLAVPERFRFVPFLIVEDYDHPERPGHDWCTSCGICAKVCPPQCIWIVRGQDPETGRPKPEPEAFYIDIDICMNCGYCAEFCPFDAIKMDHDYELASYDRTTNHVFDKQKLSKEFRYWKTIAPTTAVEEAEARGGWEHIDIIKAKKKAAQAAEKAGDRDDGDKPTKAEAAPAAEAQQPAPEAAEEAETAPDAEEMDPKKARLLKRREEMLKRKRERESKKKN